MHIVISFALVLSFATAALAQDQGYPAGTLVPEVDLGLQPTPLIVPEVFRGAVPQDLVLNLPPGFSAHVFAHEGLRKPRFMAFDPNGVLHVANMGTDQIVALPDHDRDGVADERIVALRGLREAHSLLFYKGALYVAEEHQVIRVRDTDGDLVYEQKEVVLPDVPWEGWHDTRTLVVDRRNDKMYLSVGSPCDLCRMDEGFQVVANTNNPVPHHPERGTILQFNPDGSDRRIFATGIRHVIGMDFHPQTNALWANHNGHDLEGRTRPPEWIDIIGDQDFMGYPLVHSHQVWSDFTIDGYEKVLPITRDDSLLAATQKRPVALVPAHYAPMGLHFYTSDQFPTRYHNAAFVAFRAGKAKLSSHPGYLVAALFSQPDGSDARMGSFITGFQAGETQGDVWGFPVGLASDAEGSLYVTSDNRNHLVIKITYSPIGGSWEHQMPDTLSIGDAIQVRATVRVERLVSDGGPPRLTADLTSLGGPAVLPLIALDDQTYQLDTRLETADLPKGFYKVVVRLEQEVDGIFKGIDFSHSLALLPPDLSVFDESVAANWQLIGDSSAQIQVTGDGPIFYGTRAVAVKAEPKNFYTPWAIEFRPTTPIDPLGFAGVRFAFHPGDIELPSFPIFALFIDDLGVDLARDPEQFHIDFSRREWQVIEIPLTIFDQPNYYGPGLRDQVDWIDALRFGGNVTGTFYLDDVRLVTRIPAAPRVPTAISEVSSTDQPAAFVLAQNVPNPFNSSTTLHFALPQAADIELAIYNLAGQKVARLARGWYAAGHYTAHWDGRNDAGVRLASGVYIYRLHAGEQAQVRKLLLLR